MRVAAALSVQYWIAEVASADLNTGKCFTGFLSFSSAHHVTNLISGS